MDGPFHQSLYHDEKNEAAASEATSCVNSLDMSIVYMVVLAAATVFIGTYEATRAMVVRRAIREQRGASGIERTQAEMDDQEPELVMTWQMAGLYAVCASGGLLLLYFFMDSLIGILSKCPSCVGAKLVIYWRVLSCSCLHNACRSRCHVFACGNVDGQIPGSHKWSSTDCVRSAVHCVRAPLLLHARRKLFMDTARHFMSDAMHLHHQDFHRAQLESRLHSTDLTHLLRHLLGVHLAIHGRAVLLRLGQREHGNERSAHAAECSRRHRARKRPEEHRSKRLRDGLSGNVAPYIHP